MAKSLDGLLYALSLLPFLAHLRRVFAFDLLDGHFVYPDGMAAVLLGKAFGVPATVTLRGTIVPLMRYRLRRRLITWTLRHADQVIAVSASLKEVALTLGAPATRVDVIPNGVDHAHFRVGSRETARARLGLPRERPILVSVGTLSLRKGHQRLVTILPRILPHCPTLLLVIVGGPGPEGDTESHLRALVAQHHLESHVLLAGPRPHAEIPDWLTASSLFALATRNEGCANVILEALACGRPVITTRVGGNQELVTSDRYGRLVEVDDDDGLTAAVVDGLRCEWDATEIAAYAERYSWDGTADRVIAAFEAAREGRSPSRATQHVL